MVYETTKGQNVVLVGFNIYRVGGRPNND